LPEAVLDEECGYVIGLGAEMRYGARVDSLQSVLADGYDAVFVGCGAPRGRDLDIPGRAEAGTHVHIGIDWLASVSFGHTTAIGKRVVVLGGGNTAMDCCRTARRLGGETVDVVVRSGFAEMKASAWEKDDAIGEDIKVHNFLVSLAITHDGGTLTGVKFEKVRAEYKNGRRKLIPAGEPPLHFACDDVLVAVGQENAFPWIERELVAFDEWEMPKLDPVTLQSSHPKVFFGGDAAFGPKNIITAVAHGHEAAISIDLICRSQDVAIRPRQRTTLPSQKMGIHEWSYDNDVSLDLRFKVPHAPKAETLRDVNMEVELGYTRELALQEAQRCLNCDIQTVFAEPLCIECDACVDICPTDSITFTANAPEAELRTQTKAPAANTSQDLYVSADLKSGLVMVKDEDVCLHCGLCAERCPTGAWDMKKFTIDIAKAYTCNR
jgi:NADPH-dependent glutamate synthase beta subunit-like oxidoreductase